MENILAYIFTYIISGSLGFAIGYLSEENALSDITTLLKFLMSIVWITLITKPIFLVLFWNSW